MNRIFGSCSGKTCGFGGFIDEFGAWTCFLWTKFTACRLWLRKYWYSATGGLQDRYYVGSWNQNASKYWNRLKSFYAGARLLGAGMLTSPLLARFGSNARLEYYDAETLQKIVMRAAKVLKVRIDEDAAMEIARRNTWCITNRLLRRTRDFAQVKGDGHITRKSQKWV